MTLSRRAFIAGLLAAPVVARMSIDIGIPISELIHATGDRGVDG